MRLMRRTVSTYSFCGGNWIVASPECTPANSMCSLMAYAMISPFLCHSIHLHLLGMFDELADHYRMFLRYIGRQLAGSVPALPGWNIRSLQRLTSTYDGRTNTGKPTLSTNALMSSIEVSARHSGWSTPMRSSMAENLSRSSALSMLLARCAEDMVLSAHRDAGPGCSESVHR